jgi:predicted small metal-binding protein
MAMRTIECNQCGEPLTGHDDEALVRRLVEHMADVHPEVEFSAEQAAEDVRADAYSATDN